MSRKSFAINHYFRGPVFIDVQIEGREKTLSIRRNDFEKWLQDTDRLEWINVTADHNGEPVEKTGVMTLAEYWDGDYINEDIIEYIIYHQPASFFDLKKSIDKCTGNGNIHPTIMESIAPFLKNYPV